MFRCYGDFVRNCRRQYRCRLLYAGPEACGRGHGCRIEQQIDGDTPGRHGEDGRGATLRARGQDSFARKSRRCQNLHRDTGRRTSAAVAGPREKIRIDLGPGCVEKAIGGVLRVSDELRPHRLVFVS